MSIKYKKSLLGNLTNKSTYEDVRHYLIGKNFVMNTIVSELKDKVACLSKRHKPDSWQDADKYTVLKLQELLNLYEKNLLFGGSKIYKNSEDVVIVDIDDDDVPVFTPGAYIRYLPGMTQQAWLERYKQAQVWAEATQVYKDIPKDFDGRKNRIKQRIQVGRKALEQNIPLYLKLE